MIFNYNMRFCSIVILLFFTSVFYAQEIKSGFEWANTSSSFFVTSPNYSSISYKVISNNQFKGTQNDPPFSNNCLLFPDDVALNTSSQIEIKIIFTEKVDSLKIRLIDLDESTNSNPDPEEFISSIQPKPYKVKGIINQNLFFLNNAMITPEDNNNSNANNNTSGWAIWDIPVDTLSFFYNRPGKFYGLIIDSIYFKKNTIICDKKFDLGESVKICAGENATITPDIQLIGKYLWNTKETNSSIVVNKSGWYKLTITEQNCVYKDSVLVIINPILYSKQSKTISKCKEETVLLTSPILGNKYTWNTGGISDNIEINTFGTYSIIVNNYCKVDTCFFEVIDEKCKCNFDINDSFICNKDTLLIGFESDNTKKYLWSTNNLNSKIYVSKPGEYWLRIYDGKCTYTDTFNIKFKKTHIDVHFQTFEKCRDENLEINSPIKGDSCIWFDGNKSWTKIVKDTGVFYLNVFSHCHKDSIKYFINEKLCDCYCYVPNTFTPNGDELNNVFEVKLFCDYSDFHFTIFDRWGEIIFESYNPKYGWDGTYNNKIVVDGVYVYKLDFLDNHSKTKHQKTGHVNLIK